MDPTPDPDCREGGNTTDESMTGEPRVTGIASVVHRAWTMRRRGWVRYARRITRNGADAEDAVQDAVSRTLRAAPALADEAAANRYVLSAVRTSALRVIEQRRRYSGVELRDASAPHDESTALRLIEAAEQRFAMKRLGQRAFAELEKLKPDQRQAIELLVLREPPLKLREVAEIQGAPISTVYSRLRVGINKIGGAIKEGSIDPNVEEEA